MLYILGYLIILFRLIHWLSYYGISNIGFNKPCRMPSTIGLSILILSLAGVPPFLGFGIKWLGLIFLLKVSRFVGIGIVSLLRLVVFYYIIFILFNMISNRSKENTSNIGMASFLVLILNSIGLCIV